MMSVEILIRQFICVYDFPSEFYTELICGISFILILVKTFLIKLIMAAFRMELCGAFIALN